MTARPVAGVGLWLWTLAVLGVSATPVLAAYRGAGAAVAVGVALLVPFLVVGVGRRLRLPTWVLASATVGAILLAARTVLDAEPAGTAGAASAWDGSPGLVLVGPLLDSVAELLTSPRPAPAEGPLLVPVAVLTGLVALTVALATVRTGRPGAAPLVGAAVLYGTGLLLTGGAADRSGLVAALVVAVLALGWLLLDGHGGPTREESAPVLGRRPSRARTRWSPSTAVGALAVVAVAAVAVVGGPLVRGEAFEPREHVEPPVQDVDLGHPLPQLAVWAAEPGAELFRAQGTLPERMSLVVLPDFDGVAWRADVSLRPVGAVTGPDLPPGGALGRMQARVILTGLVDTALSVGGWLPAAGRLVSTDVPGALTDPSTGSLLAVDPVGADAGGERGYQVVADVDQPSTAVLRTAGVPSGPSVARYLATPRMPADLREFARTVTAEAHSRLEQIRALQTVVRGDRELVVDGLSGSSYARVRDLMFAERDAGGQVGSSEQFASAFAVLARAVGLPSRVVVGFVLPPAGPDGQVVVLAEHAEVWPEVYLAGAGWVVIDVNPSRTVDSRDADPVVDDAGEAQEATPLPADEEETSSAPSGSDGSGVGPSDQDPGAGRAAAVTLTVLATVLLLVPLVGLVRRRRRSARLRRAGVRGAWEHVEDALRLAGAPPRLGEGALHLAARVDGTDGRAPGVLALAERAETATFAPDPVDGGPQDWAVATDVHRVLRRSAPWARRLTWRWRPLRPQRSTQATSETP